MISGAWHSRYLVRTPSGEFRLVVSRSIGRPPPTELDEHERRSVLFFAQADIYRREPDALSGLMRLYAEAEQSWAQAFPRQPSERDLEQLCGWLERALKSGQLQIEKQPELRARAQRPVPQPKPAAPAPESAEPTTFFEVCLVDELGKPISGQSLVFSAGGEETVATGGDGHARKKNATVSFGSVRVGSIAALREALRPRWEQVREGEWVTEEADHTYQFCRDPLHSVSLESERLRTLVIQPRVVQARLLGMFFATDKCFLMPSGRTRAQGLVKLYESNQGSEVLVVGHADTKGNPSHNNVLSLERAKSVIAFLTDDVDAWLGWYGSDKPEKKRWGASEDGLMLGAVLMGEPVVGSPLEYFQQTRGLQVDNRAGDETRRQLITEYMDLEGTSLPAGVSPVAHGCGESFPLDASGEELDSLPPDNLQDLLDRRVELFFFDGALGILPPPPGELSAPGSKEYPEWRKRSKETLDFTRWTKEDLVVTVRCKVRKTPLAGAKVELHPALQLATAQPASTQPASAQLVSSSPAPGPTPSPGAGSPGAVQTLTTDQEGKVAFLGLDPGAYELRVTKDQFDDHQSIVTVNEDSSPNREDVWLASSAELSVQVTADVTKLPIAGAAVDIQLADLSFSATATTGTDGAATFSGIPSGKYKVRVVHSEYRKHEDDGVEVPQGSTVWPVSLKPFAVTFNAAASTVPEVIDLVIVDRIPFIDAVFDVDPEAPITLAHSAAVYGAFGVIRKDLPVVSLGPNQFVARWDGRDDAGALVALDVYDIRFTLGQAIAASPLIKVIRIGVTEITFDKIDKTHPLKFAFDTLATGKADDFLIPTPQWKLESLDEGGVPRAAPSCSVTGKSTQASYSYPISASIKTALSVKLLFAGSNYTAGDTLRVKLVQAGTSTDYSTDSVTGLAPGSTPTLTANDKNQLAKTVEKGTVQFDVFFETKMSNGAFVRLGRQRGSAITVYVVAAAPQRQWGEKAEPVWVELLEYACSDWAKGATTLDDAAGRIVEAVFGKMGLTYDTTYGGDPHSFTSRTRVRLESLGTPSQVWLRNLLRWLANGTVPPVLDGYPDPPVGSVYVNCTCCGAFVSTIANSLGGNLMSSIMRGRRKFACHKIIAVGDSVFHHPFRNSTDTAGGFSYHEVAWTGAGGDSDQVFDGCLQLAKDPISSPATDPIWAIAMVFLDNSGSDPKKIEDYKRRLIRQDAVTATSARPDEGGIYKPV